MATRSLTVDVLVVGGGPAGARAARAAAQAGAKVLLVEAKRRGGALPHCAEFVPRLLGLEVEVPARARVQAVQGMETRLAGQVVFTPGPGWVLDRQVFDMALLEDAAQAGAEVWVNCRLLGRQEQRWLLARGGQRLAVRAGAVVAADGAASGCARLAGWPRQALMPGLQVTVPLAQPLERTLIFLAPEYAGGYAWLFPKGRVANLGLGCRAAARPRLLLEALRQRLLRDGLILPGVLAYAGGAIPVGGPRQEWARAGVILAGDAAGLTHPVTGAGIPQAVFSGGEAGQAAVALAGGQAGAGDSYAQALTLRYRRYLARGLAARQRLAREWRGDDFSGLMRATWPAWGTHGA
ncbi:MAG: geranylgeranyl reductase family protein [Desulfarculus sp.]|nr:geranylgeranyl reductase family protein [Desulfarculus sp.]